MSSFKGFEVVPSTEFGSSGWSMIRITVSATKVGLSRPLIEAIGNPSYITCHKGVGENEGKLIIAAVDDTEEQEMIRINTGNKKIYFGNSDFSESCAELVKAYTGGGFNKGTYYSIGGIKIGDGAYVFDFHDAVEHTVKVGMRGMGVASLQRPSAFSASDRSGVQDRVLGIPSRPYSIQDRNSGIAERAARI